MTSLRFYWISVCVIIWSSRGRTGLVLNQNRYENLYIAIEDNVKEDPNLLTRIQDVFTEASSTLFKATDNKVYFGKIRVIVPKSWPKSTNYLLLPKLSAPESYVKIANGKVKAPHVRRRSDLCGDPGLYMYLTPDFLLQTGRTEWGKHANVIVHEWGHLRWGLFDEYPIVRNNKHPEKFYIDDNEFKPVRCSSYVDGKVGIGEQCNETLANTFCNLRNVRRRMHPDCNFCPSQEQSVDSSVMSYSHIDALITFCDKDDTSVDYARRHNSVAPNTQNLMCKGMSAWEVMRMHKDFKSDVQSLPNTTNVIPDFEFVQEGSSYRVFVLDTSGSMQGNLISLLKQTCEYIIKEVLSLDSWLGIVTFSHVAMSDKTLQHIKSDADRNALLQALPTKATGGTCIGCGLEEGLKMLKTVIGNPENGELILISDGQNTDGNLQNSRQVIKDAKIVVHTIAVTQNADSQLADIARETGGKHFTYLESGSISFSSAFSEAISTGITDSGNHSATLVSEKIDSSGTGPIAFKFTIEEGLGKDTSVTVLTEHSSNTKLHLTGPNNYTDFSDMTGNTFTVTIPGEAQAGDYAVEVTTSEKGRVEYTVKSSPTGEDIVRVTARLLNATCNYETGDLPIIYADVRMSYAPVLNTVVTAKAETGSNSCEIELKDNGLDPDGFPDDGTYSGFLTPDCLANGRINIKVSAKGISGETKVYKGVAGSYSPYTVKDDTDLINGSFQRVTTVENLMVENFKHSPGMDVIAPGRITDVRVQNIQTRITAFGESRNFTVIWTAPGNDKNIGKAASYQFRISSNQSVLLTDFDNAENLTMLNDSVTPQISGTQEALQLAVDAVESYTDTAYFAIRAVDEAGNAGTVSNIISITVSKGYRVAASPGVIEEVDFSFTTEEPTESSTTPFKQANEGSNHTGLIVGVILAAVVLVVLVIVLFYILKIKKRKKNYQPKTTDVSEDPEEGVRLTTTGVEQTETKPNV